MTTAFIATGVAELGSDPNSAKRLVTRNHRVSELGSDPNFANHSEKTSTKLFLV